MNVTTASVNTIVSGTRVLSTTTTSIHVRTVFSTTNDARCIVMENGTSPAPNTTQIMNGGIGLDGLVKTSPPIEKAVSGGYYDVDYYVGILSVATAYDVYCAQASSPRSEITGVLVTPGKFTNDRISLSDKTQDLNVTMTYEFTYDYDIEVDEIITLSLPFFTAYADVAAHSTNCGSTTFDISHSSSGMENFQLNLTVKSIKISKNTGCTITLTSLKNPESVTNEPLLKQQVTAAAGSVGKVKISEIPSIVQAGTKSDDTITLNNTMPGANAVTMNYTFKYNKNLTSNDAITLYLPYWNNTELLSVYPDNCPGMSWNISSNGIGLESYELTLTVDEGILEENTLCTLLVEGLTNLPVTESNIARHSVSADAGSLEMGFVSSSDAITAMRQLNVVDGTGNAVDFDFVLGKLDQTFTVPSTDAALNFTAQFTAWHNER